MTGKLIPYIGIGLIQASIILLAARYVFQVPFFGNIGAVYLSALLFIAANLTVGITFSSLAQNQLQAVQLAIFFFLPNILLSGFMFPFEGMPKWAQAIGNLLPLTYFIRLIRGILLKGNGWADSWPSVWPMMVFMVALMACGGHVSQNAGLRMKPCGDRDELEARRARLIGAVAIDVGAGMHCGPEVPCAGAAGRDRIHTAAAAGQTVSSAGAAGVAQRLSETADVPAQWWTLFHSPELDSDGAAGAGQQPYARAGHGAAERGAGGIEARGPGRHEISRGERQCVGGRRAAQSCGVWDSISESLAVHAAEWFGCRFVCAGYLSARTGA